MTTEPTLPVATSSRRSPAVIGAIVVAVVLVLAGGAFVAYKLTRSNDAGQPAYKVAREVQTALDSQNTARITTLSTPAGKAALLKLSSSDTQGLTFGGCSAVGGTPPSKACVFDRPGGQLTIVLVRSGKDWKVNAATLGPAALPPTSSTT
jgi:hypothetical protein